MLPLYPLGMPGGYLAIAYATAHWLKRRHRRGGPQVVTSAWLGWILHRAAKMAIARRRPGARGKRGHYESFPSGHTTGATALALTMAYVLYRERLISRATAVAIATLAPTVMGVYRVLDDEHWATDIFGGWVLGAAIATASVATLTASPRRVRPARGKSST
jgi:membrane-associated phospholipid phosphatase